MEVRKIFHFLLIAGMIFLFSCKGDIHETPPNIVWITSEDNSVHYMDLYWNGGAATPHITALAEHGIIFRNAYSNAPVCSVARSTIISGCYAPRIGAQYHRKQKTVPMPDGLKMFPAYLREAGYYTTNNAKEDYNIIKGSDVWDESSGKAHWKNRGEGQPFFHVYNIGTTHESRLHFTREEMERYMPKNPVDTSLILPEHPKTDLFAYTNAFYRDKIMEMDQQLGEVVKELEEEGLMESTFIFYYGDHGGVLPGSKGYLYETGLHVPMVVHIPENYKHLVDFKPGSEVQGFVSFTDLAPTVLRLAGMEIPGGMDGKPFLGKGIKAGAVNERDEAIGYADRFDEKYDMVRSLRKGRYKYIRSYQPFNFDGLWNNYRYIQLAYREWLEQYNIGQLNELQSRFFMTREPEMLFDMETDPYETQDLSGLPEYSSLLLELRSRLRLQLQKMPDLSFYPEDYLIENAMDDPVSFGQQHKKDIINYMDIADLALQPLKEIKEELLGALGSADPWKRYWALIVCSAFQAGDENLVDAARQVAANDPELLNRVRAAEYLGIVGAKDPAPVMTRALYTSQSGTEGLLVLNSIILMIDGPQHYEFSIQPEKMKMEVRENSEVKRRIKYLTGIEQAQNTN
ncbi:MAG: sulfatase-like hydrolase/transferase [Bacteroidales bacterium]|nr:sulfatase-like hydrolase/transferase [Bacteroidales bacterium]